jgi:predicted Zn-dependent protease
MNESQRANPGRNEDQQSCVLRYEAMLARKAKQFFDVEEFELIIDHYLERNEPKRAEQVVSFAKQLHPGSGALTFCEAVVMMASGRLAKALTCWMPWRRWSPGTRMCS